MLTTRHSGDILSRIELQLIAINTLSAILA